MRAGLVRMLLPLLLAAALAVPALANTSGEKPVRVIADGYALRFDVDPMVEGARVLVPWRAVAEFFGFTVDYEPVARVITTASRDRSVVMQVDRYDVAVDGVVQQIDVPARVVSGRTLVPLRFAAEALGLTVDWDWLTRTVYLTGNGAARPEVPPLTLSEVKAVVGLASRGDTRELRRFTMPDDHAVIEGLVTAWQQAVPAFDRNLEIPTPPYGTGFSFELESGNAAVWLAWSCQDDGDGRRCTNNDEGYVYLKRGPIEDVLVHAPVLAEFIRTYPTVDGE